MKRVTTGFCVAATFGCIATLGAQTPTTPTTTERRADDRQGAVTSAITGCLSQGR